VIIDLNEQEIAMLREALDSHLYWQLADSDYRRDGYVFAPVADDTIDGLQKRAEALRVDALMAKLGSSYFDDEERESIATGLSDDAG
jgi:hypothetical protein